MDWEVNKSSEENKDVKENWQDGWVESKKFEVSESEYNKLKEVEQNKTIALKKEREEAQWMRAKLDEYDKLKKEEDEKDLKKKGKYEELLNERDEKLGSYEKELTELRQLKESLDTKTWLKIEELKEQIPESERELMDTVLDWKDSQTQVLLLEKFVDKFKWKSFTDESGEDNKKVKEVKNWWDRINELHDLIKKGKARPSEKSEYLILLNKSMS